MEVARTLEENNIITNYQALPDDETFLEPSGIRMGVQEMTRFGMGAEDFDTLAGLIADVLINKKNVKTEVLKFRQNFKEMQFTLPAQAGVPIAARIMRRIAPSSGFADMFAENLQKFMEE